MISAINDFASAGLSPPFRIHRSGEDAEAAKAAGMASMQRTLPYVEALAAKNAAAHAGCAFLVGAQRTAADVLLAQALFEASEACLGRGDDLGWLKEAHPHMYAVVQSVLEMPGIAAYLKSELRYPPSGPEYVRQVDEVLGRL